MQNGVVLITYADSLGGNLRALHSGLKDNFHGCFSGIHILPFFPSSGDRGFSPVTYSEVDSAFGTWEDIASLGTDYELMADFMINHISRKSVYYENWIESEDESPYSGLFLPVDKIFGEDGPTEEEVSAIYRRQPTEPWLTIRFSSGKERRLWCTFSDEQIDIDIASEEGLKLFIDTIKQLSSVGIKMIRLDAVGYITKKRGTSCFMVEPEIWERLETLKNIASKYAVEILPEMHEHYSIQLKMASRGYPVYDFALPLLLLYSWYAEDFSPLKHWLSICPRNQFTTLDTHDGIGVVDAADLLTPRQTDFTIEKLYSRGSNIKRKYSTAEYQNLDIYQVNCTYYSALGEDDDAYIMARAIQFFTPGIPQIYYVGLLAGQNDLELVERTRNGRDINRHDYTTAEIEAEQNRPVVRRLKSLLRFRMDCRAFAGVFSLSEEPDRKKIELIWSSEDETAVLSVNISEKDILITHRKNENEILHEFRP